MSSFLFTQSSAAIVCCCNLKAAKVTRSRADRSRSSKASDMVVAFFIEYYLPKTFRQQEYYPHIEIKNLEIYTLSNKIFDVERLDVKVKMHNQQTKFSTDCPARRAIALNFACTFGAPKVPKRPSKIIPPASPGTLTHNFGRFPTRRK
jgi:hypothetical protein